MMDPRTFWNDKFQHDRYAYGTRPNAFVAMQAERFAPGGEVLSLGEGEGRNAVFLAEQGLKVTAFDASPRGLEKLAQLAQERGVTVEGREVDLRTVDLGTSCYDGIYNVYCHLAPEARQALYAGIRRALRPGGVFVAEQFSVRQLGRDSGGPKDAALLLTQAEFEAAFADFEVRYAAEETVTLDEGPLHQGEAVVVRFVAVKP